MSGDPEKDAPKPSASKPPASKPCPICGKPPVEKYRPFCSKRCADVDLNRWLSGAYAIPVTAEEDEDGEPPETGR
ncbi:DNA gyrase inhibitor YacG [Xanthobacter sp. V0B-10]|uniref:DNA gyrase inhibitor YacG n=1 Tax=Xanthobacter albus TaxID=3119929 RepID=UPI00372CD10E